MLTNFQRENWKRGIYSRFIFLMAFNYLRPTPLDFFNPMQRFWRIISLFATVYFVWVIVMLNHTPTYGRSLLAYFDPSLKKRLTKADLTYDDNCELTWGNLWDNLDHYYAVHLGNWFLSSFVIRNFWLLHFKQLIDEVIELSL